MKLRIFIYRPGDSLRPALQQYIESLGHEVAVINYPQTCLQYHSPGNICAATKICSDVIIVGPGIALADGLAMLERRMAAGCRGAKNNAVIAGILPAAERRRAEAIGCRHLAEPLDMAAIGDWLAEVAQQVDRQRELSPFTIGGTAA